MLSVADVFGVFMSDGHPAVVRDDELIELRRASRKAAIATGDGSPSNLAVCTLSRSPGGVKSLAAGRGAA